MAIITISEQSGSLGLEVATRVSQRLGFVLVDGAFVISKLNTAQVLDEEEFIGRVIRGEFSPEIIKKLIIETALKDNIIVFNLGGEVLFRGFPGALHVKIHGALREFGKLKRGRNYTRLIKGLYGRVRLGSDFYDLQIKVENMDTDFALDLILKAAEAKGISAKAGLTWRALEKLKASLEKSDLSPKLNEEYKHLSIPSFAHPSERDFARVLDFYRIKWEYEPRSFPIKWDNNGNAIEKFTPDFYLPELDLYIELTTLKQSLVTKKNRKVRMLRELYPDVNIKIFYGRDYKMLLERFGIKGKGPK
jgi:hypothetical protein